MLVQIKTLNYNSYSKLLSLLYLVADHQMKAQRNKLPHKWVSEVYNEQILVILYKISCSHMFNFFKLCFWQVSYMIRWIENYQLSSRLNII